MRTPPCWACRAANACHKFLRSALTGRALPSRCAEHVPGRPPIDVTAASVFVACAAAAQHPHMSSHRCCTMCWLCVLAQGGDTITFSWQFVAAGEEKCYHDGVEILSTPCASPMDVVAKAFR